MPSKPVHQWCGGCQQWGGNPPMKAGKCNVCDRTEAQIIAEHGLFNLTAKQKALIHG